MRLGTVAVVLALAAVPLAGCGGGETTGATPETVQGSVPGTTTETTSTTPPAEEKGDAAAGKQVFDTAGCGSCHTLSDAGTNGTVGPNLDDAEPSYDLAIDRVTNGRGAMPPFQDQLSEAQIQDVAKYVSTATGT